MAVCGLLRPIPAAGDPEIFFIGAILPDGTDPAVIGEFRIFSTGGLP
jgi:hypothetical protein